MINNNKKYKGIILAGGLGTRLLPLTKIISKHLLPVYDKPMIYYPLSVLLASNINEILIISTKKDIELYKELLGDGVDLGISIKYKIQYQPRGIGEAFILGEEFIGKEPVCLILGDNIFCGNYIELSNLINNVKVMEENAKIFAYYIHNPKAYGVIELDRELNIISLEEKPVNPKSNYIITGLYFYNNSVVDIAKHIKPSKRGELEITSINKIYHHNNKLKVNIINNNIKWFDAGDYDNLLNASRYISKKQRITNKYIGCIEEIAYLQGYIGKEEILKAATNHKNTPYGKYLEGIANEK